MTTSGQVELTVLDGGAAVNVPANNVQVVLGTAEGGTVGQVVATRNANTLKDVFLGGPLVQAGGMSIARGAIVLACRLTSASAGAMSAVVTTALGGTSTVTATGTPNFGYLLKMVVDSGGTIGATGIKFRLSADAGRTFGPQLSLGTANTYVVRGTGITLNFAAGTLVAGATYTLGATEPRWDLAGVQGGLSAIEASPYALTGWGSTHLVGGPVSGSVGTSIQTVLAAMAGRKLFTSLIAGGRDAALPAAYGGAGETEAAWTSSVLADFSATNADRLLVTAGHYNLQSVYPLPDAGLPAYRLPLSYALAARQVTIPPQRHAGRVKDGSILELVVDPTNDPTDGFVYHDERMNPSFRTNRFAAATTRARKGSAFYFDDPNMMSGVGSVFSILPYRNVMDIACGIVVDVGADDINEDTRLNKNGTILENEARAIERKLKNTIATEMVSTRMLSDVDVSFDREWNIRATKKAKINVTIWARGYILEEDVTIGFGNDAAA